MTSGTRDGPGPADEQGRRLLLGDPKEDESPEAEPLPRRPAGASAPSSPAAASAAKDGPASQSAGDGSPADLAATLESLDSGQRRLEAKLADVTAALSEVREAGPTLAQLERMIEEASEWINGAKGTAGDLFAVMGKHNTGLRDGRRDLNEVVEGLKIREKGLEKLEDALAKGVGELRALWKSVGERLEELASGNRERTDHYKAWTGEAAVHRQEMATLSEDLRSSGADMRESVTKNAKAQLDISVRTLGNVREFKTQNDRFLERFDEGGKELLGAIQREWTATRRWTVPAMAAAMVVVALSFPVLGAWAQSELGVFDAYDDTKGWKQFVWDRHGERIKGCILASRRTGKAIGCGLQVDGRGLGGGRATRLPPLPAGGDRW